MAMQCEKCHGKGLLRCSQCHGEKKVDCPQCHGTGLDKTCQKCKGAGMIPCQHCDGAGGECDEDGNWIPCKYCGGTKGAVCPDCNGNKQLKCEKCSGSGKVECQHCGGTGHVPCSACKKREEEQKKKEQKKREERERKEYSAKYERECKERERIRASHQNLYWYIILGVLGSPLGLHFAYAKRWVLMLWHLALLGAALIVHFVPAASALCAKLMSPITTVAKSRLLAMGDNGARVAGAVNFVLSNPPWLILAVSCICSVLFMRNDSTNHKMKIDMPWKTSRDVYVGMGILAIVAGIYELKHSQYAIGLILMLGWHLLYAGKFGWLLLYWLPILAGLALSFFGMPGSLPVQAGFIGSMVVYLVTLFCKKDGEGRTL